MEANVMEALVSHIPWGLQRCGLAGALALIPAKIDFPGRKKAEIPQPGCVSPTSGPVWDPKIFGVWDPRTAPRGSYNCL